MGVEPLIALPPRVLVAGRLQCGAARAGVRRGHGECAVLAHLARGSSKNVIARHAENGPLSRDVGENTILAASSAASTRWIARGKSARSPLDPYCRFSESTSYKVCKPRRPQPLRRARTRAPGPNPAVYAVQR